MSYVFFIKIQNNVRSHFWILSILRQEKWGFFIKKKLKKDQISECNTTQNKKRVSWYECWKCLRLFTRNELLLYHTKIMFVCPYRRKEFMSAINTYIYMNHVRNRTRLRHIFEPMNRYESLWSISHNVFNCNFQVADIKYLHSLWVYCV